ncbi:MAG: hypothetical protein MJ237_05085 [bacterium]|nr:hypothetical protein [bacterium]
MESFNLNTFLNEYKTYNTKQFTGAEIGKQAMEQRVEEKIEKNVAKKNSFLELTLREKFLELGIGEKVVKQIGDSALNIVKGVVAPISEYYDENAIVFNQEAYHAELQSYAKQMFFANQALTKDVETRITTGQKLVWDM